MPDRPAKLFCRVPQQQGLSYKKTKWASPLQLPYPSIMRGLDTLRAEHNCEAIFYLLCEYPRFAGADPAHIIFCFIGRTLPRFSMIGYFL